MHMRLARWSDDDTNILKFDEAFERWFRDTHNDFRSYCFAIAQFRRVDGSGIINDDNAGYVPYRI